MYCRLKAVSRYETYLNMGLYLPKRLNEVFFSFTAFHKPITGLKFFKILGLQDVNVCKLTDILNNPMLRPIIEWANSTILKGFIRQCPYSAGWVLVENASFVSEEMRKLDSLQTFPNGYYRLDLKLFNRRDDNISSITLTWMT